MKNYTRSLKPEAIIYALKKCGFIHEEALTLLNITHCIDEVQITYTILK